MPRNDTFVYDALTEPVNALLYQVTRQLTDTYPERVVFPTTSSDFDLEAYAEAGLCTLQVAPGSLPLFTYSWWQPADGVQRESHQVHWELIWEGQSFEVVQLAWEGADGCSVTCRWLLASSQELAEHFFAVVLEWNREVRGEVLVFSGGYWSKSEELYKAIQSATFDNLVLPGELKQELQHDLQQFFDSRALYQRYGIPWKRGILLVGPPGNGKTHTIKALLNWLQQPCLYVKSFKARHYSDMDGMKSVFDRARQTTPCVLVLEDLDSLITDQNRSFFLNELDGFASNTGIVLVATTNHPENLDSAIVDRPSRFDRKYHFPLPAPTERTAYLAAWNQTLDPDLRLSEAGQQEVVALTEGFSFAYLKELFLSSLMRWINAPQAGGMDAVMVGQCQVLREQMSSAASAPAPEPLSDEED